MIRRKPTADFFIDGDGMYTRHCSTKEQALKAMLSLWETDQDCVSEEYKNQEITLDRIEETRYYTHKRCNISTIGDNDCYECGEQCGTNGRKTFIINFD